MLLRECCTRIVRNFKDPVLRGNVMALMGGKLIGLTLVLTAMRVFLAPAVYSPDTGQALPRRSTRSIPSWTLIAAFLVFGMQVGFVMLEAGFARSRESINILVEGIVDTCICGVTFWAWGFAFMFEPGNGFIGTTGFFLKGAGRYLRDRPGCRCWRSGCSSLPLPTPARRLRRARWSVAAASSATSSTASASRDSSIRSSATGRGDPMAGWRRRCRSTTSPGRPSCTPSVARFRLPERLRSVHGSVVCSGATAAARRCPITSSSAPLAG